MSLDDDPRLFNQLDASAVLEQQAISIDRRIDAIPELQFRSMADKEVVAMVVEEGLVVPLKLYVADRKLTSLISVAIGPNGAWTRLDDRFRPRDWVRGVRVRLTIPFEGKSTLWDFRPGPGWEGSLHGSIEEETDQTGLLHRWLVAIGDDAEESLAATIEQTIRDLEEALAAQRVVLEEWNLRIETHAREAVSARRKHLSSIDAIPERLKIPLVVREGRAEYRPIELRRREVTPVAEPKEPMQPTWHIGFAAYETVLHVVRHFGRSFEGASQALQGLKEPQIRDLFLAALNVYFEGNAVGERFLGAGYTDISIEEASRAVFVAEFKLWKSRSALDKALQQILDYTKWRHSKCAVVLLARDVQDFTGVRRTIERALPNYPAFRRFAPTNELGEWRVVLGRESELGDEVTIHIFAFDIRLRRRTKKSLTPQTTSAEEEAL